MNNRIITVLGDALPDEMGVTDAHNHIWISPVNNGLEGAPVLNDQNAILDELIDFSKNGGGSQIDCQPYGCGRDAGKLKALSLHSGVKIVAATGFHLKQYYSPDCAIWNMSCDEAYKFFLSEINQGCTETLEQDSIVQPGFIKIAVGENFQTSPLHLVEAAVHASQESGLAILMHTEKGQSVENFVNLISKRGLPPNRLVICHIDKRPDYGLHRELGQSGFLLEYDTFFRPKYEPEKNLWPLINKMLGSGFSNAIALGTDLADDSLWKIPGGGPGLSAFMTTIVFRLEKLEFGRKIIEAVTGANIAARLAKPD